LPGLNPDPVRCGLCFRRGFQGFLHRAGIPQESLEGYLRPITAKLREGFSPPEAGAEAWRSLRKTAGNDDIFLREKRFFTMELLGRLPSLREALAASGEPAMGALAAATWCNLVDPAQGNGIPPPEMLAEMFGNPLARDGRRLFLKALETASSLLILGDNAGETVMDRLFLELSGYQGRVFYMVRPLPVMNDATREDAVQAGLHRYAEIVDSGSDVPSVIPSLLSESALRVFRNSDLVLAKGQGNLEGLWDAGDPRIHHSFVVKCPVVAEAVGLPEGSGVFVSSLDLEARQCPYTSIIAETATPSTSSW
jgi:uncharacterized protein with ATP-grasp and redox domains